MFVLMRRQSLCIGLFFSFRNEKYENDLHMFSQDYCRPVFSSVLYICTTERPKMNLSLSSQLKARIYSLYYTCLKEREAHSCYDPCF